MVYRNSLQIQYSIGDAKRSQILTMELNHKLRISNELGLHARAAARIVELAKQYKSSLFFSKDDREVDGSSILSILTLACPKGTELEVRVVGEDSKELLEKLGELFEQKFGESG